MNEETDILALRPSPRRFIGGAVLVGFFSFLILYAGLRWFAVPASVLTALAWSYLKTLFHHYRITSDRVVSTQGLISRRVAQIELWRVTDVFVHQTIVGRILNVGDVAVVSADRRAPDMRLVGLASPVEMKEQIRAAFLAARDKRGIREIEVHAL